MGNKVLVLGTGGREHALAWKLAQSDHVDAIYANADWVRVTPKCERANFTAANAHEFAKLDGIDLTVAGPEQPLIDGVADRFLKKGLRLFGPLSKGARLESDKAFAKEFMDVYEIQTAPFMTFKTYRTAQRYLESEWPGPVYVKASGIAAGKGALPGRTQSEALEAARRVMIQREFGTAGDEIVIERLLPGEEASCTALFNSNSVVAAPFLFSQDHKKLLDDDQGPNTGGMGAYAPTTLVTPDIIEKVYHGVLSKTLKGLEYERVPYCGFLYPGLIIHEGLPSVLEFNVRLGDPETQPITMLADFDLFEALVDTLEWRHPRLSWKPGYAVCIVLASQGYAVGPKLETGKEIHNLYERDNVVVFHAGTKYENEWRTNGGRVLGVTGYGSTINEAVERAYGAIGQENGGVWFDGMQFRRDIGHKEVLRRAA